MKQTKSSPNIDMLQTGLQLKLYMDRAGMSVKDIQENFEKPVILDAYSGVSTFGIYLSDVADVIVENNSNEVYANVNGKPGVLFTMEKQTGYSTGNVSKALAKRFADLEEEHEGLHFITLMDQGDYIDIIVSNVVQNMVIGAALATAGYFVYNKIIHKTYNFFRACYSRARSFFY